MRARSQAGTAPSAWWEPAFSSLTQASTACRTGRATRRPSRPACASGAQRAPFSEAITMTAGPRRSFKSRRCRARTSHRSQAHLRSAASGATRWLVDEQDHPGARSPPLYQARPDAARRPEPPLAPDYLPAARSPPHYTPSPGPIPPGHDGLAHRSARKKSARPSSSLGRAARRSHAHVAAGSQGRSRRLDPSPGLDTPRRHDARRAQILLRTAPISCLPGRQSVAGQDLLSTRRDSRFRTRRCTTAHSASKASPAPRITPPPHGISAARGQDQHEIFVRGLWIDERHTPPLEDRVATVSTGSAHQSAARGGAWPGTAARVT